MPMTTIMVQYHMYPHITRCSRCSNHISFHSKKYLDPLFVCTMVPLESFTPFFPTMVDVVTTVPSWKDVDPKIRP